MPVPRIKLNDGTSIPIVGFGVGTALFGKDCLEAVSSALKIGFDSVDCAQQYSNSQFAGQAIKSVKREDLYILTKFGLPDARREGPDDIEPRRVLQDELKKLGVSYVDMFLVHNPKQSFGDRTWGEVWKTLEALKSEGLTKSIGVSNFMAEDIAKLAKEWTVPPAVNQVKYHPYWFHTPENMDMRKACDKHGIKLQAYGPQQPLRMSDPGPVLPVVEKIAKKHDATPGQVLLAWGAQYGGGTVVTTSRQEDRRKEMLEAFTKMSPLTEEELNQISEEGKKEVFRQ